MARLSFRYAFLNRGYEFNLITCTAIFAVAAALFCSSAEAGSTYLASGGASEYRLVLEPGASPSEKHAAEEIQSHFKSCVGVELPIIENPEDQTAPMIVLGCGPIARKLGVNPKAEELGEQGYLLRTAAPHVVIAGTREVGTLYGAYDFLEQALNVRWWAPDAIQTPLASDVLLPEFDSLEKPEFLWRHLSSCWPDKGDFRPRMRDNAGSGGPDNPEGLQYSFDGTCHTYYNFINPTEFFDSHPEYFSEIGGVRRKEETQLCLTNPEVLDIVTERMLAEMEKNPNAKQYNFSQMDWYSYCQCPKCAEINAKYETTGGTQFWFVNQLAERIAKVHPDKLIGTLAYMYTEEPPKEMRMHPNVAVWLCHMYPSCDSHSIDSCPLNAEYKRRAKTWATICDHVYIWHYIIDFAHLYVPFPNFRAMAKDMKFYKDIGVEGIYLQGGGWNGGEFDLLRPYYGAKLLWNPELDEEEVMQDFLKGYYEEASEPIMKYIDLLSDKVERENIHMHLYTNPAQGYLPDDILEKADELFNQAEFAVKDKENILERVRVARMPLTFSRLFPRNGYTLKANQLTFQGPFASLQATQTFLDRMKRHNFTQIRETNGDPMQLMMLAVGLATPTPTAPVQNDFISVDVAPFLGGRALRILDKRSGQTISAFDTRKGLFYPFNGGEETRIGGLFDPGMGGFTEQYNTVSYKPSEVVLQAKTGAGVTIRRTITVAPDKPVLTIKIDATNSTDAPREIRIRSHFEMDLGEVQKTRLRFTSRTGENVDKDAQPILAGMREGEHYLDQSAPKGAWTFSGTKGLDVTQTFDDSLVDFTWAYAYPDYLNDMEVEVWAKPQMAQPGQTVSFEHSIEIQPTAK
jgi:hypothetical protein